MVYKHTDIFHYGTVVQNCIGAIDGTHIPCTPIGVQNPTAYRNRKGFNSLNVMAACSFDMKFTYIFSGWEGSAHDARVLADAVAEPKFKFPHPPLGKTANHMILSLLPVTTPKFQQNSFNLHRKILSC